MTDATGGTERPGSGTAAGPRPLRICFVAHFAYGALVGETRGHVGGVERQTSLMARWLARRGHQVTLVTWDEGQPDGVVIDGVRVLKVCRATAGVRGLRFLHPRWTGLTGALGRAGADVYYHNCGEYVTGQVALWARWHGRRFVYSVASDPDCDARLPLMASRRERLLYRLGVRYADRIVVQTGRQQQMLRAGFGRESVVAPMPCPGPEGRGGVRPEAPRPDSSRVLWVGRVCEVKRPDRLLDLAEACPELAFDLVGPTDGSAYASAVLQRAAGLANVAVHGRAARSQMPGYYAGAAVLCCTSDTEGFPNTFIEAWSVGLPVVSTFDPDGLIVRRGLGATAREARTLAAAIRALLAAPDRWRAASARARRYYAVTHTLDRAMPRFERIFRDVAAGAPVPRLAEIGPGGRGGTRCLR